MKNRILSVCLLLCVTFMQFLPVQAKETKEYTEVVTFQTDDKNEKRDHVFEEKIEKNGKKYDLTVITYNVKETEKEEKVMENSVSFGTDDYRPKEEIVENGVRYQLKSSIAKEVVVEKGYDQEVTAYTEYDYPVDKSSVPHEKTVTVKNDRTGEMETVTCSLTNITTKNVGLKNTHIDITFQTYNADVYDWNGIRVIKNTESPLAGYEKELLQSVGADTGKYKVSRTYWVGEPYTNEQGVLCRKARADVLKDSIVYRADYVGKIVQEEIKETVYTDTYEYVEGSNDKYEVEATAHYTEVSMMRYYMLGAAILIFAGIIILYIISKKKKEKEEENDVRTT